MDSSPNHPVADLGWSHVGFGLTFIAFDSIISQALQLHIGSSLVFAALRCVVQLTLVATILQHIFAAENFWAVVGIACKYVVSMPGVGGLTDKFDSRSIAELDWHDRSWCVRYLITFHFSLTDPRVSFAKQVVVKAGRRCEDMVRVHGVLSRRGMNSFVKFGAVLIAMLISTIPVSILGVQFAMRVLPFWTPAQYSEYCYPFPRA